VTVDPEHGGKACEPSLEASEQCKEKECPVHCEVSEWSAWSACSTTCGVGSRSRSRNVSVEAKHGGAACEDALEGSEECKDQECPVHCELSAWSNWTACSATCGDGTKTRSRSVTVDAKHGGKACDGALEATDLCKDKECPIHCELSDWSPWGDCSTTCGKGTRSRNRHVSVKAQHGGKTCEDALKASEECKDEECPVHCVMSNWADWDACSKTCGGGTRSRSRTVTTPSQHGGMPCGNPEGQEDCNVEECPVDCVLSDWSPWKECSATCGDGTKTRERNVTVAAQHGGKACEGALEATEGCKEKECPVHCELSDWSAWSACSTTCGKGTRNRSRSVSVKAQHGGKACEDALEGSEECKDKECPIDCVLSAWSAWGACSATCGRARAKRTRSESIPAQHGGKPCRGWKWGFKPCSIPKCPSVIQSLGTDPPNLCLDYDTSGANNVIMWNCNFQKNQMWYRDGLYIKSEVNGKCLDYDSNTQNVGVHTCNGQPNQRWMTDHQHVEGTMDIRLEENNKCLDISGANMNNHANVHVYECNGDFNQAWNFEGDIHHWHR